MSFTSRSSQFVLAILCLFAGGLSLGTLGFARWSYEPTLTWGAVVGAISSGFLLFAIFIAARRHKAALLLIWMGITFVMVTINLFSMISVVYYASERLYLIVLDVLLVVMIYIVYRGYEELTDEPTFNWTPSMAFKEYPGYQLTYNSLMEKAKLPEEKPTSQPPPYPDQCVAIPVVY